MVEQCPNCASKLTLSYCGKYDFSFGISLLLIPTALITADPAIRSHNLLEDDVQSPLTIQSSGLAATLTITSERSAPKIAETRLLKLTAVAEQLAGEYRPFATNLSEEA